MHRNVLAFVFIFLSAVSAFAADSVLYHPGNRLHPEATSDTYLSQVQPILSSRCVACHGCYESPCQTNFESYEGLRRGFNPVPLFSGTRLGAEKPTRMIDAASVAEWRQKGFHPIVRSTGPEPELLEEEGGDSLLYQLLAQGSRNNAPGFSLDLGDLPQRYADTNLQCVASARQMAESFNSPQNNVWQVQSLANYQAKYPGGGMPFGLTKLSSNEEKTLLDWLQAGAQGPSAAANAQLAAASVPAVIERWEAFLNGDDLRSQHSARYIYEHVYTAHLLFDENPGEYFELVRSRTRTGGIDQIVTVLPYDVPGVDRVYYRLKKITRAIAGKTHFVWHLNDARLAHLQALFLQAPEWAAQLSKPEYGSPNPFRYFAQIPARVRSTFMMENARVIVSGMTQGSVCVGSTATYAIADHFWAWFLKPEVDPSVQVPSLGLPDIDMLATAPLEWEPSNAAERLAVHELDHLQGRDIDFVRGVLSRYHKIFGTSDSYAAASEEMTLLRLKESGLSGKELMGAAVHFNRTVKANHAYQEAFEKQLRTLLSNRSLMIRDLWSGDGDASYPQGNPNAWLNITRHGKSATVQFGDAGGTPQSIWVLSYSNFERLYYNLVASYQEWGSLPHKMATWRHMSYVRLEGEDLAISYLPPQFRDEVRARFTSGLGALLNVVHFPLWSSVKMTEGVPQPRFWFGRYAVRPSVYGERSAQQAIDYVVAAARGYLKGAAGNWRDEQLSPERADFEHRLDALTNRSKDKTGDAFPQFLPSDAYVRIGEGAQTWLYSFISDRAYKAHNIMVAENLNRRPEGDSFSWYRGIVGNYPNVFFSVPTAQAGEFLQALEGLKSADDWKHLEERWGVRRNGADFWPFFDWLHQFRTVASPGVDPTEQGIADLSQYEFF